MSKQQDTSSIGRGLTGRRILVTRASQQASELAERLRVLGATPVLIPTIEIAPPASFADLDAALASLVSFDLVAFTSANAVEAFQQRAQLLGHTPAPRRIAVVGPATARAVAAIGLHADIVPPIFTAESLAQTICRTLLPDVPGACILLVLVEQAPATLADALEVAGARVTVAAAYRNRVPSASLTAIAALFAVPANYPDAVTFTSASTAGNLIALLDIAGLALPAATVRASIGPVTSRALSELGLPPHLEAAEPTLAALADALASYFHAAP